MELKVVDYSLKNCPIPSLNSYLKLLIDKTESFLRRLRWRTIYHKKRVEERKNRTPDDPDENTDSDDSDRTTRECFGFPSANVPPEVDELKPFERDLWNLVDSVTISEKRSRFQKKLQEDVKTFVSLIKC